MQQLARAQIKHTKINESFQNSAKWKILKFQGSRVVIYHVSFFIRFLQINNNIPFLAWIFCPQATWKWSILNSPPCLKNETYENKIDLDAHLESHINRWLLLLSIILQNI